MAWTQAWLLPLKESYAASGSTLSRFAGLLGVAPERLAAAVVRVAPERPTRAELVRLMQKVVPALRS